MKRTSLTLCLLLAFCFAQAQQNRKASPAQSIELLAHIDSTAGRLLAETNAGRFEYELQRWRENAAKVADAVTDNDLYGYKYKNLKMVRTHADTSAVLFFVAHRTNQTFLTWLTTRKTAIGRKAHVIIDEVESANRALETVGQPLDTEWCHGFAVTQQDKPIFAVPDLDLRLAMELIADIKTPRYTKDAAIALTNKQLEKLLSQPDAFTANLAWLPRLMAVSNNDHTLRVCTYMAQYTNFDSQCHGFLLFNTPLGTKLVALTDCSDDIKNPERAKLTDKKWFGAVYSSLREVTFDKRTYYTLLGYKQTDGLVKTRVIEILTFVGDKVQFGAPVFRHEKATYLRRIFQYSANANMMMRFDERKDMLVFDHLSPSNSMFAGEYRHYGPDFSYDGYSETRDGWKFESDIDLRRSRDE